MRGRIQVIGAGMLVAGVLTACGADEGASGSGDWRLSTALNGNGNGQNREMDIETVGTPDLTCGGEVCFFIGSEKNITHVWVRADGCEPGDFRVEIDGHAAGPSSAGPPDCDEFGGVRFVTGGRNETSEYFDTRTVCVFFDGDVDPGEVAVQAKTSATCEDLSVGTGECTDCGGGGGSGGEGGSGGDCPVDSELTISKEADAPECAAFGTFFEISYTYRVENTGEGTVSDIVVRDSFNGADSVEICTWPDVLEPGDSFECEFILEECADARICIENEARASGVDECEDPVASDEASLRICVDLCSPG